MSHFFQFRAYLTYWLDAVEGHSLHSPFFFNFYNDVVARDEIKPAYEIPERIRARMLADVSSIPVTDLGAGSRVNGKPTRRICDIARTSLTPAHRSRLLDRIAHRYDCRYILELGTSLGINTLYLAASGHREVITFEGSPEISRIARNNFAEAGVDTITVIEGDIGQTLPSWLRSVRRVDLVYIDANHRYAPTMAYFNAIRGALHAGSVVIIDDIHYHPEMEKAWKALMNAEGVRGSADLFRTGILFFEPSLNKQHVVLQH